jgi:hypothetical protein
VLSGLNKNETCHGAHGDFFATVVFKW